MKKLTIKEVNTVAIYQAVEPTTGNLKQYRREFDGKTSVKTVLKNLDDCNVPYVRNSVEVVVVSNTYRIPMDIIKELMVAEMDMLFITQPDNDEYKTLELKTGIYSKSGVTPIQTWELTISDEFIKLSDAEQKRLELRENEFIWTHLCIPKIAYDYIINTYCTDTKTNKLT